MFITAAVQLLYYKTLNHHKTIEINVSNKCLISCLIISELSTFKEYVLQKLQESYEIQAIP